MTPKPKLRLGMTRGLSQASEQPQDSKSPEIVQAAITDLEEATWLRTCFYASPIGPRRSPERKHANAFQNALVEPAVTAVNPKMTVIRGDQLPSSPMSGDIFEHLRRAGLVIADISFHNPNVFLEIGLRLATGKPCVLISRHEDKVPSDLSDDRVVRIDASDIGSFHEELHERRAELANRVRWALDAAPETFGA